MTERTHKQILDANRSLGELERLLEEQTGFLAVLFVDLCGSSALKALPQKKWLPVVCQFLSTVTEEVHRQSGRVVKYIGDEVLAVFEDMPKGAAAARALATVQHLNIVLESLGPQYKSKYAIDFGAVARVDFPDTPWDVLGSAVDRCARIARVPEAGTVVAGADFVKQCQSRAQWRSLGSVQFKGISGLTEVFQLDGYGASLPPLVREAYELSPRELCEQLDTCRKEVRVLRGR